MSGFDAHRIGEHQDGSRRCLTDAEMAAKKYRLNSDGVWVIGEYPLGVHVEKSSAPEAEGVSKEQAYE